MSNISNTKKKNPGHLYLTLFTGLPVTLNTQLFFLGLVLQLSNLGTSPLLKESFEGLLLFQCDFYTTTEILLWWYYVIGR
jgi:hypothetical protein